MAENKVIRFNELKRCIGIISFKTLQVVPDGNTNTDGNNGTNGNTNTDDNTSTDANSFDSNTNTMKVALSQIQKKMEQIH